MENRNDVDEVRFGVKPEQPSLEARYSANRNELFAALSKAQAEMSGATKGSENPFFKSKYADLHDCQEAIRKPFATHHLCVVQTTSNVGGSVTVETTLGHASGQWMMGTLTMTPERAGPQALGACISYARRYALAAISGLAQVDDDAETATIHKEKGKGKKAAPVKKKVVSEDIWLAAEKVSSKGFEEFKQWFETILHEERAALKDDGKRFEALKEKSKALSVSGAARKAAKKTEA